MADLQLYVKNTSNCEGLPLQTFDLLGPTWQGESVTVPFDLDEIGDGADETLVMCEVTGWTDLFGGRPCPVKVAWARRLPQPTAAAEAVRGWPDFYRTTGILLWGGNSGLRVTGPGAYEDGFGLPLMWLEDETLLPDHVAAAIQPADQVEGGSNFDGRTLDLIAGLGFPLTAAALRARQAAGLCVCGHAEEDHGPSGACEVDGCLCGCWEPEDESEG